MRHYRGSRTHTGRRRVLLTVVALTATAASTTGCGNDTAGPEKQADVSDVTSEYFGGNKYVGRTVTISAAVSETFSPQAFQVAGDDFGDQSLLVLASQPLTGVGNGDEITATGTVRSFDYDTYATQYGLGDDRNRYQTYGEELVLVASNIDVLEQG